MNRSNSALIAQLADELEPVAAMKPRDGLALAALAGLVTVLAVWLAADLWDGMISGEASAFFFVTNGLLLVLGLAAVTATVALASPSVGNRQDAPKWALAMVAILPFTALATVFAAGTGPAALMDPYSLHCLTAGTVASSLTFVALTYWLRRGAPVSAETAGFFAGIASGAIGSFAYGLSCPIDGVAHLGLWHVFPVAIAGLIGRALLPRLIRW